MLIYSKSTYLKVSLILGKFWGHFVFISDIIMYYKNQGLTIFGIHPCTTNLLILITGYCVTYSIVIYKQPLSGKIILMGISPFLKVSDKAALCLHLFLIFLSMTYYYNCKEIAAVYLLVI